MLYVFANKTLHPASDKSFLQLHECMFANGLTAWGIYAILHKEEIIGEEMVCGRVFADVWQVSGSVDDAA
jgi:hypothetical protein